MVVKTCYLHSVGAMQFSWYVYVVTLSNPRRLVAAEDGRWCLLVFLFSRVLCAQDPLYKFLTYSLWLHFSLNKFSYLQLNFIWIHFFELVWLLLPQWHWSNKHNSIMSVSTIFGWIVYCCCIIVCANLVVFDGNFKFWIICLLNKAIGYWRCQVNRLL
jgi:hypothetical protein